MDRAPSGEFRAFLGDLDRCSKSQLKRFRALLISFMHLRRFSSAELIDLLSYLNGRVGDAGPVIHMGDIDLSDVDVGDL